MYVPDNEVQEVKAKATKKSDKERKIDRDELEATTKKRKTPRVTPEGDDEATVTTVSDVTTTSTGGDPINLQGSSRMLVARCCRRVIQTM